MRSMPKMFDRKHMPHLWLRYALAVILLATLIWIVPAADIWHALVAANPAPLGLAVATILAARLLGAKRAKVLTDHQGLSFSLRSIFEISCAGTLYSLILPGSYSGGLIRWYRFSQPTGRRSEALAVLAAERVVDFLVLALFGLLCLVANTAASKPPSAVWGLAGVAATCLLLSLFILSGFGRPVDRWLQRHKHKPWMPELAWRTSRRILSAFRQYRLLGARKIIAVLVLSVLFHTVATASLYLMARALDLNLAFFSVGWLRALITYVTALPLTPSGFGIREFSLIYLLLPFGVSSSQAVAFSLIQYAGMLFVALLGALMEARRYLGLSSNRRKSTPG
jgi:uncharacterized protein (TIRG00374 family)